MSVAELVPVDDRRAARDGAASWIFRIPTRLAGWLLGALLCMTPATAIVAQGWLMGRMRRLAVDAARRRAGPEAPAWAPATPPATESVLRRGVRVAGEGVLAALSAFLGLLPFTALVMLSWWGGWENSFSKGYEQSWVGPTLGLLGVAIGLPLLARLPMALAHQAVERRFAAFFERRVVRRIMAHGGWEHVALTLCLVLAASPLFAAKGLPVFVEQIRPGFEALTEEEARAFARGWRLAAAAYLFGGLWLLRGWSARLYAKARLRSEAAGSMRLGFMGWVRLAVAGGLWFGLIAQIYVGQFLNHDWADWLNPPLVALPVAPSLGG